MINYIQKIADKIKAKNPVFLYTLGGDTLSVIKELDYRYGVTVNGICDGDITKQGKEYRGSKGHSVISVDEALLTYPNAEFFVSSMDYRFQIMGELIESEKVLPERIINYEPIEKRRTCSFFEKSIFYKEDGKLVYCCIPKSPIVAENEFNDLRKLRKEITEQLADGRETEDFYECFPACENCAYIREDFYPVVQKSWWLNYFGSNPCNYKCSYCNVKHMTASKDKIVDMDKLLTEFKNNGMMSDWYGVIYSTSGEPTLHPARKKLYEAFDGYAFIVNTNGSIFDEDLFCLMNREKVRLIISIDAGTKETYKIIKGLDTFEKVKSNLIKYSKAKIGITALKYLFIPNINDNEDDINGFVKLCLETNCGYVLISYAYGDEEKMTKKTYEMIKELNDKLKALNFFVAPYTQYESPEYAEKIRNLLK